MDFDNVTFSKDFVHCLAKVKMIKLTSLLEDSRDSTNKRKKKKASKILEDFESCFVFLSSYAKAKELNDKLESLFTIVDERNFEQGYKEVLQFYERLKKFVDYPTKY
jgi:hypothetical protein